MRLRQIADQSSYRSCKARRGPTKRKERRYLNRRQSHRTPAIATAAACHRRHSLLGPHVYAGWPNKFPLFYNGDLCPGLSTTTKIARAPDLPRGTEESGVLGQLIAHNRDKAGFSSESNVSVKFFMETHWTHRLIASLCSVVNWSSTNGKGLKGSVKNVCRKFQQIFDDFVMSVFLSIFCES